MRTTLPGRDRWGAGRGCQPQAGFVRLNRALLRHKQFVPVGENVPGLQLGYFPGYVFLFAVGITAWRHDWVSQLEWKRIRPWIVISILVWPSMSAAILVSRALHGFGYGHFSGGLSWTAILYALWEPFVACGVIVLWLVVFRQRMNKPSPLWDWLNRRAYAVYILHPTVLVGISLAFHGWVAPPLLKFGITGTLTIAACWLISDPFVRLPGLRRIV